MSTALEVRDLKVSLSGTPVVRGLTFDATPGVWFGLLGANGSGKTTLLRALNGRLPIDGGQVLLAGADVTQDLRARAVGVGFAPPPDSLPLELTGGELLDLLARSRDADWRAPPAIHAALDIGWLEDRFIGAMSAGMRQRLCLFTAFIGGPAVVLLDEPFNWLDPVAAHDLKSALRGWTEAGGALVTALHGIADFATRCDAGLLLHEGRAVKTFTPAEIAAGRGDILAFEQTVYEAFKGAAD